MHEGNTNQGTKHPLNKEKQKKAPRFVYNHPKPRCLINNGQANMSPLKPMLPSTIKPEYFKIDETTQKTLKLAIFRR